MGYGSVHLTMTRVDGNSAGSEGGGVQVQESALLVLTDSSVDGNEASEGGGVYAGDTIWLDMVRSSIDGNDASSSAGAAACPVPATVVIFPLLSSRRTLLPSEI